jgi:hypothetical protein
MFDSQHPGRARSNIQVLLGFLFGVVASLASLFFAIILAATLGMSHRGTYALLEAIALTVLGMVALRNARQSSYAVGLLVAVSLSLLLDGLAAVYFATR